MNSIRKIMAAIVGCCALVACGGLAGCGGESGPPADEPAAGEAARLTPPGDSTAASLSDMQSGVPALNISVEMPMPPTTADAQPVLVPLPFYTVGVYDPARDPAHDLAETVRLARAGNKRILIQVGGEWCGWCHKLDRYIAEHGAINTALDAHFLMMKVNYSEENRNAAFLSQYPHIPGYPHLYVLESDGTLLHSQGTLELEEGPSYNEGAILAFLERWKG